MKTDEKIKDFASLLTIVAGLRAEGKRIVQSHGIFDILHPGIIRHIESARCEGDILVITVIRDRDVKKGPGYPIFNEHLRAENAASLAHVDLVAIVDDTVPFQCVSMLKPDIFARGQDYHERDQSVFKRLQEEEELIKVSGCKIHYTPGRVFSSTSIINNFLDVYPEEIKQYLRAFKEKYDSLDIIKSIKSIRDLRILLIGDAIIDEYYYCEAMGKSIKDNIVVNRYLSDETFAGGSIAIANHLAGICDNIHLVTLLGSRDSKEDFILSRLRSNVSHRFFRNPGAPTIVKRRFLDHYLNQKLFEICFIHNIRLPEEVEKEILGYLDDIIQDYDIVLVADFGHGLLTEKAIDLIQNRAPLLAVNVQTNGANAGYNMITKYSRLNFACIDFSEARLACQDRYGEIEDIIQEITRRINSRCTIVTMGSRGSYGLNADGEISRTPALASRVVDRIGAGDAFFAYTAPCFARNFPLDLISFIGNAVGALAVQVVCNREPVEPSKLFEFIFTLLR